MPTDTDPIPFADRPQRYTDIPLPPYRYLTGKARPHPIRDNTYLSHNHDNPEAILLPDHWPKQQSYQYGIDLFNLAYWWETHEVLEDLWKQTNDPQQKDFLQSLILLAVALLKWHLTQYRGTKKLARRARRRLQSVLDTQNIKAHPFYMGINITALAAMIDEVLLEPDDLTTLLKPVVLCLHDNNAN